MTFVPSDRKITNLDTNSRGISYNRRCQRGNSCADGWALTVEWVQAREHDDGHGVGATINSHLAAKEEEGLLPIRSRVDDGEELRIPT